VHVCAGSGSVPNFAILKYALHHHPKLRHTFVYSNRTWDDVIFRNDLQRIAQQNPERVRLLHTLTREAEPQRYGRDVRSGRIGIDLLREAILDPPPAASSPAGRPSRSTTARPRARPGRNPPRASWRRCSTP
jgi:ferredoxin-NADP reductase